MMITLLRRANMLALTLCLLLVGATSALACSEIFVGGAHPVSARTFDFMFGGGQALFTPRGVDRQTLTFHEDETPLEWTAQYGNITFSAFMPLEDGTSGLTGVDGINEAGFKVGTYYLPDSVLPQGAGGTVLNVASFVQYAVDRFATVEEFIADLKSGEYRVTSMPTAVDLKLHLFVHDASGQSAIIEYIDGKLDVIRNPEVPILTNTPYRQSIEDLKAYHEFGGETPIPGGQYPLERFVRGAYYSRHIPTPESTEDALASATAAIMNLTVPPFFDYGCTFWHLITDMKNKTVYIHTLHNRKQRWVNLNEMDMSEGNAPMTLDFQNPDLSGNVKDAFKPM